MTTLVYADGVRETTISTGSSDITLAGAPTGFRTFNTALGIGPSFPYRISAGGSGEWEVGEGHLAGATTLVRDAVLSSSNGGSLVNFSSGTKDVLHPLPAAVITALSAASGTVTSVTLTQPAAGIVLTNSGTSQSPMVTSTLSLANDLAGVEGLATTGIVRRTATDTWSAGTAVGLTTEVTGILPVANGGTGINGGTSGGVLAYTAAGTLASSAALTSNAVVLGGGAGVAPKVVAGVTTDGTSALNLGVAGTSVGKVVLANATSGTITIQATTGALGTVTLTAPAITDTLVTLTATQTLTNKTLTSPTLTTPALGTPSSGTLTNCTGLPVAAITGNFDDIRGYWMGAPAASVRVLLMPIARTTNFAANFAGSYGAARVAATASTAFDIQKNGSSIGTATFAIAATTAAFVTVGGTSNSMVAGDILQIIAPATPDATLFDIGFCLLATL